MKRIISVILCFACICMLLTACGKEEKDPAKIINGAIEKTASLNSLDATIDMEIEIEMNGISLTDPMTMVLETKASGIHSGDLRSSTDAEMSVMGVTVEMNTYLENEWVYVTAKGSSFKMKTDKFESFNGSMGSGSDYLVSLPEDLLKDIELIPSNDGSQSATISVPDDVFATLFEDVINSASSTSGSCLSNVTVTNAQFGFTIKDGYVTICDVEFDMKIEASGVTATSKVISKVKYNNPGSEVTVTPPEGYQSFEEMDDNSIFGA